MIYYEFDRTGKGGKYKEMTDAEYKLAKQDPNRFFLEGWDEEHKTLLYIMECSHEEFTRTENEQDGIENRLRDKSNRKATVLSLEGDMVDLGHEVSVFDVDIVTIDEEVLEKIASEIMLIELRNALGKLPARDQLLIRRVYMEHKTQV